MCATAIGAAVAALTTVIEFLCTSADKATKSSERLAEIEQPYAQAYGQAQAEIQEHINTLQELIAAKKKRMKDLPFIHAICSDEYWDAELPCAPILNRRVLSLTNIGSIRRPALPKAWCFQCCQISA